MSVCGPLHVAFGGRLDVRGAFWLLGGRRAGRVLESLSLKAGLAVGLEDRPGGGLRAGAAGAGGVAVLLRWLRVVAAPRPVALVRLLRGSLSRVLDARVLSALGLAGPVRTPRLTGLRLGIAGVRWVFGGLCFGRWVRFFGGALVGEGLGFLVLVAVGVFGIGFGREFAALGRSDLPSEFVRPWLLGRLGIWARVVVFAEPGIGLRT